MALRVPGMIKLALCTDHPVIPIQYLPTTAALAVKGGMKREDALYAITAGAAEILGVENRVGSIAPGMDGRYTAVPRRPVGPAVRPVGRC